MIRLAIPGQLDILALLAPPDPSPTLTSCECGPLAARDCGHCAHCDTCFDCERCAGRGCRCECWEDE